MHSLPIHLLLLLAASLTSNSQDAGSPVDYAPNVNQTCPDVRTAPLVRVFTPENQTLHPDEQQYIDSRLKEVIPLAWQDWIGNGSAIGYDLSKFNNTFPKIGLGVSGGGYRAAQYGAGVLSAIDARNGSAKAAGTGGLLQVSSYLAGLSGGSWLTGSLYFNNWPTVEEMVFGGNGTSGWLLDIDLATPDGLDLFSDKNQYFYGSVLWSVIAKANKWIDTSLTDPWARMISYHFLNQTTRDNFFTNDTAHGAGQLWSHIPRVPAYQLHQTPFPLVMANSRPVGSNLTTRLGPESTVYEVTPFEFGSWDPSLSAMMNLTYAGTHLTNGVPDNDTSCVTAFEQAGFIMGTSASLFNQALDTVNNKLEDFDKDGKGLLYTLQRQLRSVRTRADDVANWPSPFRGIKNGTFQDSEAKWLELIDGSSNVENVPLGSLFVKSRALDVVVAIDSTANDGNKWPNGTSILFTRDRLASLLQDSHQQFPIIPNSQEEFIVTGVRQRPTFFGCNNFTTPLVIYLPNAPPLNGDDPVTNTATFKIDYTPLHSRLFIDQTHANTIGGFLEKSNSPDPKWGQCLQCAALDRARYMTDPVIPRSATCAQCFSRYCFDPNNLPNGDNLINRKLVFVDPQPTGFSAIAKFFANNKFAFIGGAIGLVALVSGAVAFLLWRRKQKAKSAQYKQLDVHVEEAPWTKTTVYDPYDETDFRTPNAKFEFNDQEKRYTVSRPVTPNSATPRASEFPSVDHHGR